MTDTVSSELKKSKVLSYYYQRRAESQIGSGERFLLATAVFGTSSLVTQNSNGTYDIADIPADFVLSDMLTQFATAALTLSYANGVITIRIELDSSQLDPDTAYPFNTFVILDSEGKACSVQCVQQDTIYKGKGYVATLYLNTGGAS